MNLPPYYFMFRTSYLSSLPFHCIISQNEYFYSVGNRVNLRGAYKTFGTDSSVKINKIKQYNSQSDEIEEGDHVDQNRETDNRMKEPGRMAIRCSFFPHPVTAIRKREYHMRKGTKFVSEYKLNDRTIEKQSETAVDPKENI